MCNSLWSFADEVGMPPSERLPEAAPRQLVVAGPLQREQHQRVPLKHQR